MERQGAGFLLLIAAAITMLIGAVVPWAQLAEPPVTFSALQMHLYAPFVVAVATALLLIGLALARSLWAAFAGLISTVTMGIVALTIHSDVYAGLRIAAPLLHYGDASHTTGFGVAVMFVAGLMAGAGGFITVVQVQPSVTTSPGVHS